METREWQTHKKKNRSQDAHTMQQSYQNFPTKFMYTRLSNSIENTIMVINFHVAKIKCLRQRIILNNLSTQLITDGNKQRHWEKKTCNDCFWRRWKKFQNNSSHLWYESYLNVRYLLRFTLFKWSEKGLSLVSN